MNGPQRIIYVFIIIATLAVIALAISVHAVNNSCTPDIPLQQCGAAR